MQGAGDLGPVGTVGEGDLRQEVASGALIFYGSLWGRGEGEAVLRCDGGVVIIYTHAIGEEAASLLYIHVLASCVDVILCAQIKHLK